MDTTIARTPYPSDISDEEWDFTAPYLILEKADAPQRDHDLREVFNDLRWIVRTGSAWRFMPHDLPPYHTVYQQTQLWIRASCFEALVHELRALIRLGEGKGVAPTAATFECPEGSQRSWGHRKTVTVAGTMAPRNASDRRFIWRSIHWVSASPSSSRQLTSRIVRRSEALAAAVQDATGDSIELAYVDGGYTGKDAELATDCWGIGWK